MENILSQIITNNKSLQSSLQFYESEKFLFKTGNTPPNPTVEYDFLAGSPTNAGNQHEFTLSQQFDFPTLYFRKSKLIKTQIEQTGFQHTALRQDILLKAKQYCIELVYQHKIQLLFTHQKQNAERLLADFQARLDQGEGTILDVNKARLQLVEVSKQHQQNSSEIAELITELTALNGGNPVFFNDTIYSEQSALMTFAQLEAEYEKSDPLLKVEEQQCSITQKQLEVSKASRLPKFEIGYHYQGILGQTYNGIHTGISIPLWENKHSVKHQKSKLIYYQSQVVAHRNEHFYQVKSLYDKYTSLGITLAEYREVLNAVNQSYLLNKALALGEINTITYFNELNFFYSAYLSYLKTEMEYHQTIALLTKYQL